MIASTTRSQLHHCLNAVDFPANKDDLITAAVRSRCDDDTVHALQAVEPATYNNAEQVLAQASIVDPPDTGTAARSQARPEPQG
ncbi:DUF2795 domain-containing protein [Mycobacterium intracellulare]|uniref:DUF2795 domain-containing protein n=1 Tax=Mycobacterium intracellulare TaxID=1767 RepID=UPI0037CCBA18